MVGAVAVAVAVSVAADDANADSDAADQGGGRVFEPRGQSLHLDLDRAPYVLYGVKYIDLVSLCCQH